MITIDNILDVKKYIDDLDVVIFDLDDTLYSEKEYVKSGFMVLEKAYPNIKDFYIRLWNSFCNREQALDVVLKEENLQSEKERCLEIYRSHFPKIHLYKGVLKMLKTIAENKRIGIITDGRPSGQKLKIDALGLGWIEKIIITDELGGVEFRKPNETAFKIMIDYFKCNASKICYIGDNFNKDFYAPEKLGMKSIYFKNKDGLY